MPRQNVYHLQAKPEQIGQYVFLPGDPDRVYAISEHFEARREVSSARGFLIHTGHIDGTPVSAVCTGVGGPSAALVTEELIALGAHTLLRVGTCGSLQPDVRAGELVISVASVRDEGTTRQYVPAEFPAVASFELVNALVAAAAKVAVICHVGITHSKDAFYSEYPERTAHPSEAGSRWATWRRANALATEMEAASIFVLGSLRACRAGAILSVVGSVLDENLIFDQSSVRHAVAVAVEAIRGLIRSDAGDGARGRRDG
ncbi:MAG TPA: nucleoside phosphorylase [Pyrinomonadaceae bacterium]|nr:nucleoside phosphorylase [Pyrinomonadaceae bacterium]